MIVPDILGDVHLGRKFVNNVPLHRRGERERMVRDNFERRVKACTSQLFVQTGDLFDGFAVEEEIVLWAARTVRDAAKYKPDTTFVFYRGNHDASKDANKASSFDVFAELLLGFDNVRVLKEPEVIVFHDPRDTYKDGAPSIYGFLPWGPFKSSTELAFDLVGKSKEVFEGQETIYRLNDGSLSLDAVFCHCDVESYGGDDSNLVPTNVLNKVTKTIYTGHVHKPTSFERDGVRVIVVGSMQPYAHGEDAQDLWYKTMKFEDYELEAKLTPTTLHNVNVRVLVKDGEMPEPIDCLSFTTKKVTEKVEDDEAPDLEVKIEDFDMDKLFSESLSGRGVTMSVSDKIMAKWQELKNGGI